MLIRISKVVLIAASSIFFLLVVFNNLTDYRSNYQFVEAVLSMSSTFEGNSGMWRAIESPVIHHLFYWIIILWETAAMILIGAGALRLWKQRTLDAKQFNNAKGLAVAGLTLGMLLWFGAFLIVGGEWFLMWQSKVFNGQNAAFRMFAVMGIVLIFLSMEDEELSQNV